LGGKEIQNSPQKVTGVKAENIKKKKVEKKKYHPAQDTNLVPRQRGGLNGVMKAGE